MRKPIPTVREWMTKSPRTVDVDVTLNDAHAIMRDEGFRHLPVLEHGKLIGIVSQRDLHLVETLRDIDPDAVTVREAMISHPYFVEPDAPLDAVVAEMAEHKFGAAVVMDEGKVVGMFTTVDALRAFHELLEKMASAAEAPPPVAPVEEPPPLPEPKPMARGRGAKGSGAARASKSGGARAKSRQTA